jgi:hypothetical protein
MAIADGEDGRRTGQVGADRLNALSPAQTGSLKEHERIAGAEVALALEPILVVFICLDE